MMERWNTEVVPFLTLFHYSSIPLLHAGGIKPTFLSFNIL
jgi:hypothetical protein